MTHRWKPTDKGSYEQQQRKEIQATGTTTKATNTQLRTTGKRQRIPKGMRNHTKTGTKGAQTTDNRTEGSTEENEQWNTSTNTSIHKNNKHQPSIQKHRT